MRILAIRRYLFHDHQSPYNQMSHTNHPFQNTGFSIVFMFWTVKRSSGYAYVFFSYFFSERVE